MDPSSIAKEIADQFVTIWHAPVPFFIAVAIAGWLIWLAVRREYATRLANSNSTIDMLEKRLNRHEADEAMTVATMRDRAKAETETSRQKESAGPASAEAHEPVAPPKPITIEEIVNLFRNETDIKAQRLLRPSIGASVTIEGSVTNVLPGAIGDMVSVGVALSSVPGLLLCNFPVSEAVNDLRRGDKIAAVGVLSGADSLGISIGDCKLL
jgi:hypothetical protein